MTFKININQMFSFALFAILIASNASGALYQKEEFSFSASSVEKLVNVSFQQGFEQFVPGYEYAGSISVQWAIPAGALSSLTSDSVKIFVKATPKANDSGVFFKRGEMNAEEYYFTLECALDSNGRCLPASSLNRTFSVYYSAPNASANFSQFNASAQIIVEANLIPFIEQQKEFADFAVNPVLRAQIVQAQQKIAEAKKALAEKDALNSDPNSSSIIVPPSAENLAYAEDLLKKASDKEAQGALQEASNLAKKASELSEIKQGPKPVQDQAQQQAESQASNFFVQASQAAGAIPNALTGFASLESAPYFLGALFALMLGLFAWKALKRKPGKKSSKGIFEI